MLHISSVRNLFLLFVLAALALGCKKGSIDQPEIEGRFICFEGELDGEIFKLPKDGFSIEIIIKSIDYNNAMVEVIPHGNGEPINFPRQECSIGTDEDGFLFLKSKKDDSMYVIFYDGDTIDCYPGNGTRISAAKSGKEPIWWK